METDSVHGPVPIWHHVLVERNANATSDAAASDGLRLTQQQKKAVVKLSRSVGRLGLRARDSAGEAHVFYWATAFVIAPNIIATTCHAIEPLISLENGVPHLLIKPQQELFISFGDEKRSSPREEYAVGGLLEYSRREGVDIAFLEVKPRSSTGEILPPKLPISIKPLVDAQRLALIGYPDLSHFIDPGAERIYTAYSNGIYAKFLVPAHVVYDPTNASGLSYTARTTTGESGSAVVDLNSLRVIAVHSCCAVLSQEKGDPPQPQLRCSRLHQTTLKQATTIRAVLEDPDLGKALKRAPARRRGQK